MVGKVLVGHGPRKKTHMTTGHDKNPDFYTHTPTPLIGQLVTDNDVEPFIFPPGALIWNDNVKVVTRKQNRHLKKGEWFWELKMSYDGDQTRVKALVFPTVILDDRIIEQSIYPKI